MSKTAKHRAERIGPLGEAYSSTYYGGTRPIPKDSVDRAHLKTLRGTPADESSGGAFAKLILLLIVGAVVYSMFGDVVADVIGQHGLGAATAAAAVLWFFVLQSKFLLSGEGSAFLRTLISKIIIACAVIAVSQPMLMAILGDAIGDATTRESLAQVGSGLIGVAIGMATANA